MQRLPRTLRLFQMSALIRCAFFALCFGVLGCEANQEPTISSTVEFVPDEDFERKDIFNFSVHLPKSFSDFTEDRIEDFRHFGCPSKDQYLEIQRFAKINRSESSCADFAQDRIDAFMGPLEMKKETPLRSIKINSLEAFVYACDVYRSGYGMERSYWMMFLEHGSDFYAFQLWTPVTRKVYFEKDANIILHSVDFLESTQ